MAEADYPALVHELQVQQIELEMQNHDLQRAEVAARTALERYSDLFDFAPIAYFLWDHAGRILEINLAGAALLGLERNELVHVGFGQFVVIEDRARFHDFCQRVLSSGVKQSCEFKLLRNGQTVDVLVEGIATQSHNIPDHNILDRRGQQKLCRTAVIDISQQKHAQSLCYQAELLDKVSDAIVSTDANFRITSWSRAAERIYGWKAEEALGKVADELFRTEFIGSSKEQLLEQLIAQGIVEAEHIHEDRYGRKLYVEGSVSLLKNAQGDVTGTLGVLRDITDRKQSELALRESEERLRMAVFAGRLATWDWHLASDDCVWNDEHFRIMGYEPGEVRAGYKAWADRVHPDDRAIIEGKYRQSVEQGGDYWAEYRALWPDGSVRWIEARGHLLRDAQGQVVRSCGILHDITQRKLAEEAVARTQKTFSELVELAPFGIYVVDSQFRISQMNAGSQTGAFHNVRPVIGRDFAEAMYIIWPEPVAAKIIAAFRHTLETGETYRSPRFINPRQDIDTVEAYEWEIHRMMLPDGQHGVVCYYFDSTKLRNAEEALRVSELGLRMFYDSGLVGMFSWNLDGRITDGNDRFLQMFGYSREDLKAGRLRWAEMTPPEYWPLDQRAIAELKATGIDTPYEKEFFRKDGSRIAVINGAAAVNEERTEGVAFALDVTERKQVDEALRESSRQNRFLAEVIELASQPFCIGYADGRLGMMNAAFERLTGYSREELRTRGWDAGLTPPEWREFEHKLLAEQLQSGLPIRYEKEYVRKDGTRVPIELLVHVVLDSAGHPDYYYSFVTDITERKQAEQVLVQAKEAADAANAAKSRFLANMSHELRTPMNAILGMIDLSLSNAISPTVQDCLQTARGSADLLLTLLNDLLDSAKIESGKLELEAAPFSLQAMLDQITRVLSVRASEKGLCFYCRIPGKTVDAVLGDRMRLQQILLNLAGNAIKFTEHGAIEIDLDAQVLHDEAILNFSVRDTGMGIPPPALERLFQPFVQADISVARRFGGTGLGLVICKSLVEMMGGQIRVESEVGLGSTFYFTVRLPIAKETPAGLETPINISEDPARQLKILLAEDNPANQKLARYILEGRGHLVEIAGDGQQAISLAEQNAFDVILMDVQMPGMSGLEATAAIRKREIDGGTRVPIVAMTALAMQGDREECLAAGMDAYLSKPINRLEFIALVERLALGSATAGAESASSDPALGGRPSPALETNLALANRVPRDPLIAPEAAVFEAELALARCANSEDILQAMVACFFEDMEQMFPRLLTALKDGNYVEVGRIGHRLKGTLLHLGAERAEAAACAVEKCGTSGSLTRSEAVEAVQSLGEECAVLKAALIAHPLKTK
jgi:PAS domain S-box-containing protein